MSPFVQASGKSAVTVGVLVDDASPAKANFTGAATLAANQINQALAQTGIPMRINLVVAPYTAGQAQNVAIDLINTQGAIAMVTDTDGSTADVNRLNYDLFSPIAPNHVTVTCHECSSPSFNDPSGTDLGYADPDNWLFRTFYNAMFEASAQAQIALNRPNGGDIDGDGFLKIVVYSDQAHFLTGFAVQAALDALDPNPHSVELVFKVLPSTPDTRAAEMAAIFDTAPDGHAPDAVYLAFTQDNILESLSDYSAFSVSPKAPAQADTAIRRNFLLPSLLAAGGAGLEGTSVLSVSATASGPLFQSAFASATGQQPELTASFLYDAVAAQALAIAVANANNNGNIFPELVRDVFSDINTPGGTLIRPRVSDFKTASNKIKQQKPIDYDGASSPLDLTFDGENYPDLVHWKIQSGSFVELERYQCDPSVPNCQLR
jgi:hypothetical protein